MRRTLVLALAALALAVPARAGDEDVVGRIMGRALSGGGAHAFLERLTDTVGGRVTGSPQTRAAQELAMAALRDAGLSNVHAEEWPLRSRWTRGPASARITSPIERPMPIAAHGWSPGLQLSDVPVVDIGAVAAGPLADPARLRGAAVLARFQKIGDDPGYVVRARTARALADAGAAALLIASEKPGRMLDIVSFGNYPGAALPMLSISRPDGALLKRLLAHGPVRVAVDVRTTLDTTPAMERNVVAEIPGRERPEEVVIVGGHLDSWDPGQGAQDDGVGMAAVVESARILHALGIAPRRTIRFVLWTGEEQAILGSQAYVKAHRAELDRVQAVLIMDSGAEIPRGFHTQGRADLEPALRRALAPLGAIGANGLSADASFDEDHAFFLAEGVPALTLWVDEGGYEDLHHAVTDTLDTVDPRALALDTAVLATAAWRLAEADERVGKRLSPAEATAHLATIGLASSHHLLLQPD